ncbi:DNA-directed RNA polymerase [Methylobacterium sp. WL6]|uniref:DNA-directed RNA polymerase n=1 Tax=Methylobacterium sp. WL6 TaxID=2603901 RepID=UPI0011C9BFC2|nr:DNA-directed RNA polymerase [Methylobacterium sp. WL6]TXN68123.1 hypothetical protein FV230_13410 [Methylobacterium sp. WL6]
MSLLRRLSLDQVNRRVHEVAVEASRMSKRCPSLLRAGALPITRRAASGDIVGGLVLFRVGLPITEDNGGARWLALHLAACFGRAGLPYAARMEWVTDQDALWRRIAEDPLASLDWAGPAVADPWSALAAALEWAAFRTTGFGMPSRLPIPLSASDVPALPVDIMPTGPVRLPSGVLPTRWAGLEVKAEMVVKDDGAGTYRTHAATAGALARSLGDASTMLRAITPE